MKRDNFSYKPPFFALRYIQDVTPLPEPEEEEGDVLSQLGGGLDELSKKVKTNFGETSAKIFTETRSIVESGIGFVGDTAKGIYNNVVATVSNINFTVPDLTNMRLWSLDDAKNYSSPVAGWARIRKGGTNPLAASVLPAGDDRYHILVRQPILRAADTASNWWGNAEGVDFVKQTTCQNPDQGNPVPCEEGGTGWKDYKTNRIEKFLRGKRAGYYKTGPESFTDIGDDTYRVVILDDSVAEVANDPDPHNRFVWVQYWPEAKNIPEQNVVQPITLPDFGDIEIKSTVTPIQEKEETKIYYNLDMYKVAHYKHWGKAFGFGIERFDSMIDSRKSVQQTRGTYTEEGSENNFYVDTWGKGPETITIVGAIELPFANSPEVQVSTRKEGLFEGPWKSFIETIETFFSWNNNPIRISRGDKLQFIDYYKEADPTNLDNSQVYDVTFKSRRFTQSIEKQSVIMFEFTFVVLGRSKIS